MSDLTCPYCSHQQDVCHDDGFGYSESERHEVECDGCRKQYVFETSISFHYSESRADCLNGEPHSLEKVFSTASDIWPDWVRCKDCDYENRGERKPHQPKPPTDGEN